jgi:hypothetical protein
MSRAERRHRAESDAHLIHGSSERGCCHRLKIKLSPPMSIWETSILISGVYWRWILVPLAAGICAAGQADRTVETVLPALSYGASCWSSIDLQNLGDRPVVADVEAHRSTGALVALVGHEGMTVRLNPGVRVSYRAAIDDETSGAWMKIRERITSAALSPILAVSGKTECVAANELRTAVREVAYPMRNPWYSTDVAGTSAGEEISLINTSERAVLASICYSSGTLVSVPAPADPAELVPLCSTAFDAQIPPFGSRQFPVEHEGNSHFSLKTRGEAVVLQMLRRVEARVNLYSVDSTIVFGGEAQR